MNLKKNDAYLVGILYAFTTSFFWGLLPALLEWALQTFSTGTIVWFRFTFAFFILLTILQLNGHKPMAILRHPPVLGILAGGALAANYLYFLLGIQYNGPTNAAIIIQLAPIWVIITGIAVFKERLLKAQTIGLFIAATGFFFFYWDKKQYAPNFELYTSGNEYLYFAGAVWALFATLLKKLSQQYPAQNLNLLLYGVAGLILTAGVQWEDFVNVDFKNWTLLMILGLNTLIAYGALSEAIRLIPLSLATVITTTNPLFTLLTIYLVNAFQPLWLQQDIIGMMGYSGVIFIITGVALVVYKPAPKYNRVLN